MHTNKAHTHTYRHTQNVLHSIQGCHPNTDDVHIILVCTQLPVKKNNTIAVSETNHSEATRYVTAKHPGLQSLNVTTNIRLGFQQMAIIGQLVEDLQQDGTKQNVIRFSEINHTQNKSADATKQGLTKQKISTSMNYKYLNQNSGVPPPPLH